MLSLSVRVGPPRPSAPIFVDLLSLRTELPLESLVVRAPADMGAGLAYVQPFGEGQVLVYWTGWQRRPEDPRGATGRVCRLITLGALLEMEGARPLRVLVEAQPLWWVAEVGGAR